MLRLLIPLTLDPIPLPVTIPFILLIIGLDARVPIPDILEPASRFLITVSQRNATFLPPPHTPFCVFVYLRFLLLVLHIEFGSEAVVIVVVWWRRELAVGLVEGVWLLGVLVAVVRHILIAVRVAVW